MSARRNLSAKNERSDTSNDVGVLLFALVDIEQVKAMRPRVTRAAARLLDLIDAYPAACRWCWLDFVQWQIAPDERDGQAAIDLAVMVDRRRRSLVEVAD